jgi:uncharacterized protein
MGKTAKTPRSPGKKEQKYLLGVLGALAVQAPPWGLAVLCTACVPSAASRPPDAAIAFDERELDVAPAPGRDEPGLDATLTLPRAEPSDADAPARRPPIVVLVPGSTPRDRDETVGPNKPFRDLAWGLGARGIAVLRYQRHRAAGAAPPDAARPDATLDQESVDDALAAVRVARGLGTIDSRRIVVLGHSLGGTAVPRIARRDEHIAGFVVMAGATRPLEDVLLGQLRYVAELDGTVSEREQAVLDKLAAEVARVKTLTTSSALAPCELPLGQPVGYWLDLRAKPAGELLRAERRPFLVLHAARDYQVTAEDLGGWRQALAADPRASFREYPALNHLFMVGSGPSTPSEYQRPGHVAAEVVSDVADWVGRL